MGVLEAGPDGPGTRAAVRAIWFWPGLLAVLLVALLVRTQNLDGQPLAPAERAHFDAAGLGEVSGNGSPAQWIKEDLAWAKRALRGEEQTRSASGPLFGLAARTATRAGMKLGFGKEASIRLLSALLGVGLVFMVAMLLRSTSPHEPLVALAGAGFTALQLGSVYGSRIGGGGTASALCLLVLIYVAWRIFRDVGEHQTSLLVAGSGLIAACSCAAFGFESDAKVYGAILAAAALLLFKTGPNGVSKWPWYSKRTWSVLVGLLPLAALVGLGVRDKGSLGFHVDFLQHTRLASWPLLALGALGLAGAFTRDMRWLAWLVLFAPVAALSYGSGSFRWTPPESYYMAINSVGIVLAAEGAGVLWGLARSRVATALADAAVLGTLAWLGLVTWSTIHGPSPARLLVDLP